MRSTKDALADFARLADEPSPEFLIAPSLNLVTEPSHCPGATHLGPIPIYLASDLAFRCDVRQITL